MPTFFYLVYQIKGIDIYWVADISRDFEGLKGEIEGFYSSFEKYYIVSKHVSRFFMPFFRQFTEFQFNKNCRILYETF